jgi:hypothetical protein
MIELINHEKNACRYAWGSGQIKRWGQSIKKEGEG